MDARAHVCVCEADGGDVNTCCSYVLQVISWILIIITLPFSLLLCMKVSTAASAAAAMSTGNNSERSRRSGRTFIILGVRQSTAKHTQQNTLFSKCEIN